MKITYKRTVRTCVSTNNVRSVRTLKPWAGRVRSENEGVGRSWTVWLTLLRILHKAATCPDKQKDDGQDLHPSDSTNDKVVCRNKAGCTKRRVIIQLLKTKCLPVLYYALAVGPLCPVTRDHFRSLDYAVRRKNFLCERSVYLSLRSIWLFFECHPSCSQHNDREKKFLQKFRVSPNQFYVLFKDKVTADLELQ